MALSTSPEADIEMTDLSENRSSQRTTSPKQAPGYSLRFWSRRKHTSPPLESHDRGPWTCVHATRLPVRSVCLVKKQATVGDEESADSSAVASGEDEAAKRVYYCIWTRDVPSSTAESTTGVDYAFGSESKGPSVYIRCIDSSRCGGSVLRVLKHWIRHCKYRGCGCDLVHIIGRDALEWRCGFRVRRVVTDEVVGMERPHRVVECTAGCFRAEIWALVHQWRCGCGCLGVWKGEGVETSDEVDALRIVELPAWFVQQPPEEK